MQESQFVYICPVCFDTSSQDAVCHNHTMVRCEPGSAGSDQRKPLSVTNSAPRWFVDALRAARGECFYICTSCFNTSQHPGDCHGMAMVCCDVDRLNEESRRPELDADGRLVNRAPGWFRRAVSRRTKQ